MSFLHGTEVVEVTTGTRTFRTVRSSVIGIVGTADDATDDFPLDTPVLVIGPAQAAGLGAAGTLLDAYNAVYQQGVNLVVVVRVDGSSDAATAAIGNAALQTGVWAFLGAENLTGLRPRILCVPGLTGDRPGDAANPVVAAALAVADRLRAIVVADGPNTTTTDALTWASDWDNARLYAVDPAVRVFEAGSLVTRPASPFAAGLIARRDNERGFHWSPSNQPITGVSGVARPVGFGLSDPQAESNILNEVGIATIIRHEGHRLWGNRTQATDPLWAFLPVRRTADLIYDTIETGLLWALDRPFSAQLMVDLQTTIQEYLDRLAREGKTLGAQVWFDPEKNTETTLAAGQVFFDFDIEPPAPIERITISARRNGGYYEEIARAVATDARLLSA